MCLMYLYGKEGKVQENEIEEASGLAQTTATQLGQEIDIYQNSSAGKLDPIMMEASAVAEQKVTDRFPSIPGSGGVRISDTESQQ